ncbi:hypothetical protein HY449_04745 [Candidatus Pacearchaeota archaeon]|nr:hypothetical protein [Candidatus Pacearchaeota archaeon]
MKQETEEQRIEGIEILERHRDSPLVQMVVKGETQFQREIIDFYGIDPKRGGHLVAMTMSMGPIISTYSVKNYEDKKEKQHPKELIDTLDEFDPRHLNTNLLAYEDVRNSYAGLNREAGPPDTWAFGCGIIGAGGGAGIGYFLNVLEINPLKTPVEALIGMGSGVVAGIYLYRKDAKNKEKLRKSKVESRKEFEELFDRSVTADEAAKAYRNFLLTKSLNDVGRK